MSKGNFKVKCIKDYEPGVWLTKGKVYEFKNGATTFDDGFRPTLTLCTSYEDFYKSNKSLASCVELVVDEKSSNPTQTITIRQKGRKVIAILTDADGKFIKAAKAKCSPEDEFDFEIGKKIAVKRLLDEDKLNVKISLDGRPLIEAVKRLGEAFASIGKPKSYRIIKQDKYEVGDKVKVREDLHNFKDIGVQRITDSMRELSGKEVVIEECEMFPNRTELVYRIKDNEWYWTADCFEGKVIEDAVKEEAPLIADGFKVGDSVRIKMERSRINTYALSEGTIEKYAGKNYTVSKVESDREKPVIRLKEDEINFAWNPELFELATDTPSFDWQSFKSGKFAVHCDTEEKAREFLKECDEQGIKWRGGFQVDIFLRMAVSE